MKGCEDLIFCRFTLLPRFSILRTAADALRPIYGTILRIHRKKTSHCGCDISAMFALAYAPKIFLIIIIWKFRERMVNVCDDLKSVGHFCET